MVTIILQLDPSKLSNPDVAIRLALPDLLVERSGGRLTDDGYDYAAREGAAPFLLLFLSTTDPASAVPLVLQVLRSERVLGNDLSEVMVTVEEGAERRVVHPRRSEGLAKEYPEGDI